MTTLLHLMIALLIPLSAGYTLIMLLFKNYALCWSLKIYLAYGLGFGLLAVWMMLLGMFHLPLSLSTIGIPLFFSAVASVILVVLKKGHGAFQQWPSSATKMNPITGSRRTDIMRFTFCLILGVYILHNVFYVFWRSLNIPVATWDAVATIAYKTKIFYFEESIPPLSLLPQKTYPLFVPLTEAWIALVLGQWSDQLIKIIFPCAFLSYLVIHYKFLRYSTNRTWALLGCTILLSSNFFIYHATISYRDFYLMYFNCITIILLLLWGQAKNNAFLVLASLFSAFTSFVKLEGVAFLLIHLIIFFSINYSRYAPYSKIKRIINTVQFISISISVWVVFNIYKIMDRAFREQTVWLDKTHIDFTLHNATRIPTIISSFLDNLFFSGNWGTTWIVLLLSLMLFKTKKHIGEMRLIALSLFLYFSLYFWDALLTSNFLWIAGDNRYTTLSRLFLHFYPLSVLLIILLNYPSSNQLNRSTETP